VISESAVTAARDVRVVLGRLRRRFNEAADLRELTPSQTSLLSRLGKQGPSSASALAAAERIRPQSAASILAALDERGLIRRRPDPDDGRRQLVSLSPAGRELMDDHRQDGTEWLARAMQDEFTEDERRTVIAAMSLLERIVT
jgi:DNA-binding MarR family transcriptional regulator